MAENKADLYNDNKAKYNKADIADDNGFVNQNTDSSVVLSLIHISEPTRH